MVLVPRAFSQSQEELQDIEQQLEEDTKKANSLRQEKDALEKEISNLRVALVKKAKAVQNAERQATEIERSLADLQKKEQELSQDLLSHQQDLSRFLMALERISRRPLPAIFFSKRPAIEETRAARLLAIASAELNGKAQFLINRLKNLERVQEDIVNNRKELDNALAALVVENRELNDLLEKKSTLQKNVAQKSNDAQKRIQKLSKQARNLKDLLQKLEADSKKHPDPASSSVAGTETDDSGPTQNATTSFSPRSFPANKEEKLLRPIEGTIIAGFGVKTEIIGKSSGLLLSARPGAKVVAPFDGKVVFEGPFRNYGKILILEHKGGYHSVLAGLEEIEVNLGQWLAAGEPIGFMSKRLAENNDGKKDGPLLYFEIRHDGQPMDPAPWLSGGS